MYFSLHSRVNHITEQEEFSIELQTFRNEGGKVLIGTVRTEEELNFTIDFLISELERVRTESSIKISAQS